MEKTKKNITKENVHKANSSASLAADYLRDFSKVMQTFPDCEAFVHELKNFVSTDSYLMGSAEIGDQLSREVVKPDFNDIAELETVLSLSSITGNLGYLKYQARRDGELFGPDDLHLMGAIAGFISVLASQASLYRQKTESGEVLKYLIDQLPLALVCFASDGHLIVENKLSKKLLGPEGSQLLLSHLSNDTNAESSKTRLHLEVEGRLIYVEGRRLKVDSSKQVIVFVAYDMSGQREKLMINLDLEAFRCAARGEPLTLALFEDKAEAGAMLRRLKTVGEKLSIKPVQIQALDAYSCAAIFSGQLLRSVRHNISSVSSELYSESAFMSLLPFFAESAGSSPSKDLVKQAQAQLNNFSECLKPALLVLDPYPAISESLNLIAGGGYHICPVGTVAEAIQSIESGAYDGLFLDWESYASSAKEIREFADKSVGTGCKIYCCSHKQVAVTHQDPRLPSGAIVFQKPFDAVGLLEQLAKGCNFA